MTQYATTPITPAGPDDSRLMILVKDADTGEMHRVTGEEALFLETLWDTVPADSMVTTTGVGALRMRIGWSRTRFDRVRYALHSAAHNRYDLLHEPERSEYHGGDGQVRAGAQAFVLRPLVRQATSCPSQDPEVA